jgi:hypothetical protein
VKLVADWQPGPARARSCPLFCVPPTRGPSGSHGISLSPVLLVVGALTRRGPPDRTGAEGDG